MIPGPLRRYVMHFEAEIERAVTAFAASLQKDARVLDAGAGEGRFQSSFARQRYTGVDLGIGDTDWNYAGLDAVADLQALPFRNDVFAGTLNIVTLEHVREPLLVLRELYRCLQPGGRILLVVPHEWEEHQQPHDYFRYTRYGMAYLLTQAGFHQIETVPVGGYFRLLARRLLNGIQFFPGLLMIPAALLLAPPALVLPLLDRWDQKKNFTLGFVCTAQKLEN